MTEPLLRLTNAEYHRLATSGALSSRRVELRRGLMVEMSPQHAPHAKVKRQLAHAIETALNVAGLAWIVDQEVSVDFGGGFDPQPDIVVWDPAALSEEPQGPVPGFAVRLVVEVAHYSLADDLGDKLLEYATAGLREYWVADVKARAIIQHSGVSEQGYAHRAFVAFGDPLAAQTTPTFCVETKPLA